MDEFLGSFEPYARMLFAIGFTTLVIGILTHGKASSLKEQKAQTGIKWFLVLLFLVTSVCIVAMYFYGGAEFVPPR
jgi:hypothetical protein